VLVPALLAGVALGQGTSGAGPVAPAAPPPVIDDATLQREYREYLASVEGLRRYEVGYIRVPDEALARRLIAQIRSGARFEEMARKHSTHAESAAKGGALGNHAGCRWARSTREILDALKPGQTWPQPVKGTHGWGIYRLVSVEEVVPRSFEQYRSELLSGAFEPECPWEPPASVRTAPAGQR
jgi:parvulin-like peptidyl-prolyl isomerase